MIVSLGVAAVSLRRRSLPTWSGAPARLVELIIAISLVVVVSQALGTFGWFRVGPLVTALVLVAAPGDNMRSAIIGANGTASLTEAAVREPVVSHRRQEAWWEPVAAIATLSLIAAEWSAGTIHALWDGVGGIDSLWYHMPTQPWVCAKRLSCQFAQHQQRQCDRVLSRNVGVAARGWHPPLGERFLSPLVNAFWLGLALFAAWCLGRRYGVGSLTTMATALMLGTTEVIADEPVPPTTTLSAPRWSWPRWHFSHTWTFHGAGVVMSGGLDRCIGRWSGRRRQGHVFVSRGGPDGRRDLLLPRGERTRQGLLWCAVVAATGGFWYARNLIYAGNPVPNVHFGLGPFRLPSSPSHIGTTISRSLFNTQAWRLYFFPGLSQALGPAWLVLVVIAAAGLVVGTVGGAQWTWRTLKESQLGDVGQHGPRNGNEMARP